MKVGQVEVYTAGPKISQSKNTFVHPKKHKKRTVFWVPKQFLGPLVGSMAPRARPSSISVSKSHHGQHRLHGRGKACLMLFTCPKRFVQKAIVSTFGFLKTAGKLKVQTSLLGFEHVRV